MSWGDVVLIVPVAILFLVGVLFVRVLVIEILASLDGDEKGDRR